MARTRPTCRLRDIVDVMLRVKAQAYSVEAANVRHEHEYKVWRDVKLPEGKILIPGVVSHATNVVEHPELVADRILAYANVVGRENVIAGTDCGLGGRVHPQIAWAKLRALDEGARIRERRTLAPLIARGSDVVFFTEERSTRQFNRIRTEFRRPISAACRVPTRCSIC